MSEWSSHLSSGKRGRVAWLVPKDRLPRDEEQRQRIADQAGRHEAADVRAAREELAFRLSTVSLAAAACDFGEVQVCAHRLRRIGLAMGFPTLAHAADNVIDCLDSFDSAALGAVVARLHRLGVMALGVLSGEHGD